MPSADFCSAVRRPLGRLSRLADDTGQISRGKLNRLQCTTAGSTLCVLDGYGLRDTLPARPALAPRIRFLFIGSRIFVPRFLQTPPRGDSPCASLTLHLHQVG